MQMGLQFIFLNLEVSNLSNTSMKTHSTLTQDTPPHLGHNHSSHVPMLYMRHKELMTRRRLKISICTLTSSCISRNLTEKIIHLQVSDIIRHHEKALSFFIAVSVHFLCGKQNYSPTPAGSAKS